MRKNILMLVGCILLCLGMNDVKVESFAQQKATQSELEPVRLSIPDDIRSLILSYFAYCKSRDVNKIQNLIYRQPSDDKRSDLPTTNKSFDDDQIPINGVDLLIPDPMPQGPIEREFLKKRLPDLIADGVIQFDKIVQLEIREDRARVRIKLHSEIELASFQSIFMHLRMDGKRKWKIYALEFPMGTAVKI